MNGIANSFSVYSVYSVVFKNRALHLQRGGFTLIEVLTALLIFGLAIVGLMEGIGATTSAQTDLLSYQRAVMLAENVMEETCLEDDLAPGDDSGDFEDEDARFSWKTEIKETETKNLLEVMATVSWNAGRGEKDYRLVTYVKQ